MAAATAAARDAYGRLLSWLAWQWRDIAAAEDALAEAFATALACWPRDGVPTSPEGWLMTAAKRNLLKMARRRRRDEDPTMTVLFPTEHDEAPAAVAVPDDRLRLMFVCAHPAIDPTVRSALMLQTVLGLDAARIAEAFLVSGEAMTKRLVRAKAKIKATGIRFEEPGPDELALRLDAVLDAIYGAYTLHWGQADDAASRDLAEEALFLAELVAAHMPDDAEALGLLALVLFCEARRPAQLDAQGDFVPLDRQDPGRWDAARIERARSLLARAAARNEPGPFQIEAAIQAAHCHRLQTGSTPWSDIVRLYERLLALHPAIGARIGHAVAVAQATGDPMAGLRLLEQIDGKAVRAHQPWAAARAHLLAALPGRQADAAEAYRDALALTREPALQRHLARQMAALRGPLH
ncbi:MAG: RNA polymerase subunit sigma-70 [Burkholderiales bacterium]|nr:MAG: RNA polymerase subunit sigma-70 [Burkholderiales bacterium]